MPHVVAGDFGAGTCPHRKAGMQVPQIVKSAGGQLQLLQRRLQVPSQQISPVSWRTVPGRERQFVGLPPTG